MCELDAAVTDAAYVMPLLASWQSGRRSNLSAVFVQEMLQGIDKRCKPWHDALEALNNMSCQLGVVQTHQRVMPGLPMPCSIA